jgi:hypothetical protein
MPRVGRSSDSRAVAKQAFSIAAAINGPSEGFTFSRLQRRGRPGFAPGSLFVGSQNGTADHQRTLTVVTLSREEIGVKPLRNKKRGHREDRRNFYPQMNADVRR